MQRSTKKISFSLISSYSTSLPRLASPAAPPRRQVSMQSQLRLPFESNYNDNFETPSLAYSHLVPLLAPLVGKGKKLGSNGNGRGTSSYVVYDPYYCNGRSASLIPSVIASTTCINLPVDFYSSISTNTVPEHDFVVTNPPYSGDHKFRCVEWCERDCGGDGYAVLMPDYVKDKGYYNKAVEENSALKNFILVPKVTYRFDHPDGTGYESSPFKSCWFCGVKEEMFEDVKRSYEGFGGVDMLEEWKTGKVRMGAKQRRRRKRALEKASAVAGSGDAPMAAGPSSKESYGNNQRVNNKRMKEEGRKDGSKARGSNVKDKGRRPADHAQSGGGNSASKYRDEHGKRVRKRF